MNSLKKYVFFIVIMTFMIVFTGCGIVPENNVPPQIISTNPSDTSVTVEAGQSQNFSVTATDADGDNLSYSWMKNGGQLNVTTGTQVTWTAPIQTGSYQVTVNVKDASSVTTYSWNITVIPSDIPTITQTQPVSPYDVKRGSTISLSVVATDGDNDPLTYNWTATEGILSSTTGVSVNWEAPTQIGQVNITVTVSDPDSNTDSYTWTINVVDQVAMDTIEITEDISITTTWEGNKIYAIKKTNFSVDAPLTINPGAIIKFYTSEGPSMSVSSNGTVVADGTEEIPIIFTSYRDDVGGDTNGDGTSSVPVAGDWDNITIYSSSTFDYCEFRYSGGGFSDVTLDLYTSSAAVTNCIFSNNKGQQAGTLNASNANSNTIITGNTFYNNELPLHISINYNIDDSNSFSYTDQNDNEYTNQYNCILVNTDDSVKSNIVWSETEVPFVMTYVLGVDSTYSLTITPGVVLKFKENGGISVSGILDADSVVFTSYRDDNHGGDTNGDGNTTSPTKKDWENVYIDSDSGSTINNCEFYYGGGDLGDYTLGVGWTSATITNNIFAHNAGQNNGVLWCAKAEAGTVVTGNTFFDNEIPLYINSRFDIDDSNNFSDNGIGNMYNGIFVETEYSVQTNLSWSETEVPFVLANVLGIESSHSITLSPGTIIKFKENGGLGVNGIMNADSVIFTSYRDDEHGGDTNGDGSTTFPVKKDWKNVSIDVDTGSVINNCEFYYGGGDLGDYTLGVGWTSATITNNIFAHNAGQNNGALWCAKAEAGTVITGNIFYNNEKPLIASTYFSIDDSNTFHNPADTTQRNDYNGIFINTEFGIESVINWTETEVPYVITDNLGIGQNGGLNLAENVILKFYNNRELSHRNNITNYDGTGVYFTAYSDDNHGGDTNGDGNITSPSMGYWDGVYNNINYTWEAWPNILYDAN